MKVYIACKLYVKVFVKLIARTRKERREDRITDRIYRTCLFLFPIHASCTIDYIEVLYVLEVCYR